MYRYDVPTRSHSFPGKPSDTSSVSSDLRPLVGHVSASSTFRQTPLSPHFPWGFRPPHLSPAESPGRRRVSVTLDVSHTHGPPRTGLSGSPRSPSGVPPFDPVSGVWGFLPRLHPLPFLHGRVVGTSRCPSVVSVLCRGSVSFVFDPRSLQICPAPLSALTGDEGETGDRNLRLQGGRVSKCLPVASGRVQCGWDP